MDAQETRRLLELAANAVGYEVDFETPCGSGFRTKQNGLWTSCWAPLHDDGDSRRLEVKLGIKSRWHNVLGQGLAWTPNDRLEISVNVEDCGDDPCAAVRLAVLLAAAAIGEAMQDAWRVRPGSPGSLSPISPLHWSASPPVLEPSKPSRKQHIDALVGDRLTAQKADHICERDGYTVTGVVLTLQDGRACIVNQSAVRWLSGVRDLWNLMHTDSLDNVRMVAEAVAVEREACAKVCETAISSISEEAVIGEDSRDAGINACTNLAAAIRARGNA